MPMAGSKATKVVPATRDPVSRWGFRVSRATGSRRLAGLLAALVLGVGLAACSNEDDPGTSAGVAPAGAGPDLAGRQPPADFQACIAEQGVELPSAPPSAGGQPSAEMMEALQSCSQYMPSGMGMPGLRSDGGG